ncbi:MAG: RnfABCDGE type electron transport complex subunit D [Spirochaetaceae bacterium]|jgi:electron transport complex protein RnfD|nr:RnfABCDGE type electron transport complex subunit D [Spirochaetaceae bacterium]
MTGNEQNNLLLQSSPHIVRQDNVPRIMSRVIIALLPVTAFGIVQFGKSALLNVAVAVTTAIAAEAFFRRAIKREIRIKDCSAAVTGLLLALVLPPTTPLWMTALGSVFAIIIAKELFGGLGANVFNPALAGRAFLLMSFPVSLTTWLKHSGLQTPLFFVDDSTDKTLLDAWTQATPLRIMKDSGADSAAGAVQKLLSELNLDYSHMIRDFFIGNKPGCIGETSIFLILVGGLFLLKTRVIDWRAPVAMLAAAAAAAAALSMDPLVALLSGGLVFGAVFMATDYTSAPVSETGKLVFGAGAGIIAMLIRKFGNYPEGVMFSILIMNIITPYLNRIQHRKYGFIPAKKGGAKK